VKTSTNEESASVITRMAAERKVVCVLRAVLAFVIFGGWQQVASMEPVDTTSIESVDTCSDKVPTRDLFAAGAFHTCSAVGKGTGQGADAHSRNLTCWGWGENGQIHPPEIDHVTSVTAGARHSCATDSQRIARCWGSNVHGQTDLPRETSRPTVKVSMSFPMSMSQYRENTFKREQLLKSAIALAVGVLDKHVYVLELRCNFNTTVITEMIILSNKTVCENQTKVINSTHNQTVLVCKQVVQTGYKETAATLCPEIVVSVKVSARNDAHAYAIQSQLTAENVNRQLDALRGEHGIKFFPAASLWGSSSLEGMSAKQYCKVGDYVGPNALYNVTLVWGNWSFNCCRWWDLYSHEYHYSVNSIDAGNPADMSLLKSANIVFNTTRVKRDYVDLEDNRQPGGMCEEKGRILGDPVIKPECRLIPKRRLGVQLGMTHNNSRSTTRDRPAFRFDGKFVCSVLRMSAGGHHTCFIYGDEDCSNCNNGYMECFGWNDYNQTDVPQCFDTSEPIRVTFRNDSDILRCSDERLPLLYKEVSAGLFHTCAISTDNNLICWGDNRSGQLGNMMLSFPEYPTSEYFVQVCAGAYHSCAIKRSGQVDCWGLNEHGQAQNWDSLLRSGVVEEGGTFTSISCGASHTCGTYLPAGNTLVSVRSEARIVSRCVLQGVCTHSCL
jgi:hypothetical protein